MCISRAFGRFHVQPYHFSLSPCQQLTSELAKPAFDLRKLPRHSITVSLPTMAHAEERNRGQSQPLVKDKGLQSPLHHLSSRFQRKLKKVKLPTQTSSKQDAPKATGHVQKMQSAGLAGKKNQLNLTVATTDSTCTCTSSRSQNPDYYYEYHRASSNQQECSQTNSDSIHALRSFVNTPNTPSDEDLFNEWLQLYASSGEKATASADTHDKDEADNGQADFFPTTTASYQYPREIQYESRNERNEMIYFDSQRELNDMITYESRRELDLAIDYWSPRDHLSDTYSNSIVSPTDTAAATNNHIATPPATAGTSCSFNFDSFGLNMLKSIKARIEGEDDESTDSDDDDDDDSSCSLNSC